MDYYREGINPAAILLEFREGRAHNVKTLFRQIGRPWPPHGTRDYFILEELENLIQAGLLTADDTDLLTKATIKSAENLPRLQAALQLSLTELASLNSSRSLVIEPLFGRPKKIEGSTVFVLMPFTAELKPVYDDHIKSVCAALTMSVKRADDLFSADSVVSDIWAAIYAAKIVIADCTGRNPNVFYEIGLAHCVGKRTVLITQNADDVPFDLRHVRYIKYALTPRGMKDFERSLATTLRELVK